MVRAVFGIICGYIVMAVVVTAGLSTAFMGMGPAGVFQADTYDLSTKYVLVRFGVTFLAAILGGYACAAISKLSKPPLVLACLILVFGILLAIPILMTSGQDVPVIREGEVGNFFDVMQHGRTPIWIALLNPLIGAAGVMAGGRLRGTRGAVAPK